MDEEKLCNAIIRFSDGIVVSISFAEGSIGNNQPVGKLMHTHEDEGEIVTENFTLKLQRII